VARINYLINYTSATPFAAIVTEYPRSLGKRFLVRHFPPFMPRIKQFPRLNYYFTRGIQELLAEGALTQGEWSTILAHFEHRCAFCGVADTGIPRTGLVADHLIPAIEHGELVVGNTVPACHDCNDLRGKIDWRIFLQDAFPHDAAPRIKHIEAYLGAFPYQRPSDPASRLTLAERTEYQRILQDWELLLTRARKLRRCNQTTQTNPRLTSSLRTTRGQRFTAARALPVSSNVERPWSRARR